MTGVGKVTTAKKPEPAIDLPLLEAGGADERLFIACGCSHVAAFHNDMGCEHVTPASSSSYASSTPPRECTCPIPRELVYIGGREPASSKTTP